MVTFEQIIGYWGGAAAFARDIGITTDLASKYRRERGIPSERWEDVIAAAKRRGFPVTADVLLKAQRAARDRSAA